jgi:hypothetical protein
MTRHVSLPANLGKDALFSHATNIVTLVMNICVTFVTFQICIAVPSSMIM